MSKITLTAAEPAIIEYHPHSLQLLYDAGSNRYAVEIAVRSNTGVKKSFTYGGGTAQTMIEQLNTADLMSTSLWHRILLRLISDGHIDGTVVAT